MSKFADPWKRAKKVHGHRKRPGILSFYSMVLFLAISTIWPILLLAALFLPSLKNHFLCGVGRRFPQLFGFLPQAVKKRLKNRKIAWLHGVSVGEIVALRPLWDAMLPKNRDYLPLIVTTCDEAAQKAKVLFPDSPIILAPLDFAPFVKRVMQGIKPEIALVSETDLWPELIWQLRDNGARVFLVNARISEKVHKFFDFWPSLGFLICQNLSGAFFQRKEDYQRLKPFLRGIRADYFGNVKNDNNPPDPAMVKKLAQELGLKEFWDKEGEKKGNYLFVAGSTHEPEELLLLKAYAKNKKKHTGLKMIIAPRNLHRCARVLEMAKKTGFDAILRSDFISDKSDKIDSNNESNINDKSGEWEIMILDTMGELALIYCISKIAFVGGTIAPLKGHSLAEAVQGNAFVLFGDSHQNFAFEAKTILDCQIGQRVNESNLALVIDKALLLDREEITEKARKWCELSKGAAAKTAIGIWESL